MQDSKFSLSDICTKRSLCWYSNHAFNDLKVECGSTQKTFFSVNFRIFPPLVFPTLRIILSFKVILETCPFVRNFVNFYSIDYSNTFWRFSWSPLVFVMFLDVFFIFQTLEIYYELYWCYFFSTWYQLICELFKYLRYWAMNIRIQLFVLLTNQCRNRQYFTNVIKTVYKVFF